MVVANKDLYNLYKAAGNEIRSDHQHGADCVFLRNAEGGTRKVEPWTSWRNRNSDFVSASTTMRQEFYEAICKELHSMGMTTAKIPKSILKELKLDDFDVKDGKVTSGKPLTARRIVRITYALAEYRQKLATFVHKAVGDGLVDFTDSWGNKFEFKADQIKTMEAMVFRDLTRRDAEKLPHPTHDEIVKAFKDGTHPALRFMTGYAQMGIDKASIPDPMKQWNSVERLATYSRGGLTDEERLDRQDLMTFVCPSGRKNLGVEMIIPYAYLCEKQGEMRDRQPTGTIRFETAWEVCTGEKMPSNLKRASDVERSRALCEKIFGGFGLVEDPKGLDQTRMKVASTLNETGLKLSRLLDWNGNGNVKLNLERDIIGKPGVYSPANVDEVSIDDVLKDKVGYDISRDHPTLFFDRERIDTVGTGEANSEYTEKLLGPIAEGVKGLAKNGDGAVNERQAKVMLLLMTQAGYAAVMNGLRANHSRMILSFSKQENGDVCINYRTPPTNTSDIDFSIVVHPDGTNLLTINHVRNRAAAVPDGARMAEAKSVLGDVFEGVLNDLTKGKDYPENMKKALRNWCEEKSKAARDAFVSDYAAETQLAEQVAVKDAFAKVLHDLLGEDPMSNVRKERAAPVVAN